MANTSNFNLRGISFELMSSLKKEAKEQHISINLLILKMLERGVGFSQKKVRTLYHDLDYLAGTWSDEETQAFEKNIEYFEKIDEELWS